MSEDQGLLDVPRHDQITIKFQGDQHEVILPLCEVLNGTVKQVFPDRKSMDVSVEEYEDDDLVGWEIEGWTYDQLANRVEQTFDLKKVVSLTLQPAKSFETYKIL